jgi:hypothetical protein
MLYLHKQFITADLNCLYHQYTTLPSSFSSESQSGKTTVYKVLEWGCWNELSGSGSKCIERFAGMNRLVR